MVVVIYDEMTIVIDNPTWCTVAADRNLEKDFSFLSSFHFFILCYIIL